MYPTAQNKTVITPELFEEGYSRIFNRSYRSYMRKILYVLIVILIVSFTYVFGQGLPLFYLFSEIIILGCVFVYISFYLPRTYKKRAYRKLTAGSSQTPWRRYAFYDDHFVVTLPDQSTTTIMYSDITSTFKNEKVILLVTSDKHNILIDPNTFTGEIPEFLR